MHSRRQSFLRLLSYPTSKCRRWPAVLLGTAIAVLLALERVHLASAEDRGTEDQAARKSEDSTEAKAQMAVMQQIASDVKMKVTDGGTQRDVDLIPDALFRSSDPARNWFHGSTWAFGGKGRPVALLSLSLYRTNTGAASGWLYEFNSLSSLPVESKTPGGQAWSTRKPGLEFKELPGAKTVAEKEGGRTRQFRELSNRFAGFESMREGANDKPERIELRLVPRPVYRYSDSKQSVVDGAIFFMVHSTNPEAALVLEAVSEKDKDPVWKYAFTRLTIAELHVDLDGKEVWTLPQLNNTSPTDPYLVFFKPITAGERGNK
jgi:hypothetical protein